LQRWQQWQALANCELIFVDGSSTDQSVRLLKANGFEVLQSQPGRALQMNAGAVRAHGALLCFVHADSYWLDTVTIWQQHLVQLATNPNGWGFCRVQIVGRSIGLKMVSFCMNYRSQWTQVATGDQGLFIHRSLFEQLQGFPILPLLEDVAFSKQLRAHAAPLIVPITMYTSGRRWDQQGLWRTIGLMWRIRWLYWRGDDPEQLKRLYRKDGP